MAEPDVCGSCSKPIHPGEPVFFHHGAALHSRCWGRLTRLQAMELAERSEANRGRAEETARRSRRLIDEGVSLTGGEGQASARPRRPETDDAPRCCECRRPVAGEQRVVTEQGVARQARAGRLPTVGDAELTPGRGRPAKG